MVPNDTLNLDVGIHAKFTKDYRSCPMNCCCFYLYFCLALKINPIYSLYFSLFAGENICTLFRGEIFLGQ